ncbi:MAG: hypothetical protein ACQKBU_00575, partial [Verrucomicrobiales bacterium]
MVRSLLKRDSKRSYDDPSAAWWTSEVVPLLLSLARRDSGRLIFKTKGVSLARRMELTPTYDLHTGSLNFPGIVLRPTTLNAIVHHSQNWEGLGVSIFDARWNLQMTLEYPGELPSLSHLTIEPVGSNGTRLLDGPARGRALIWEELWPFTEDHALPHIPSDLLDSLVSRQKIELCIGNEYIDLSGHLCISSIDVDQCMVRLSDCPRTQVCYANLAEVVVIELDDGS